MKRHDYRQPSMMSDYAKIESALRKSPSITLSEIAHMTGLPFSTVAARLVHLSLSKRVGRSGECPGSRSPTWYLRDDADQEEEFVEEPEPTPDPEPIADEDDPDYGDIPF